MDKAQFWTVFKADLLFSVCSITIAMTLTILLALWRKKKLKAAALIGGTMVTWKGPRAHVIGGTDPAPGHCPLCGQRWPLTGPDAPPKITP